MDALDRDGPETVQLSFVVYLSDVQTFKNLYFSQAGVFTYFTSDISVAVKR